jgi:hypothetical protein
MPLLVYLCFQITPSSCKAGVSLFYVHVASQPNFTRHMGLNFFYGY